MVKNCIIRFKVDSKTEDNYDNKCRMMKLDRTALFEKIANEDLIFLDLNTKKIIELLTKKK